MSIGVVQRRIENRNSSVGILLRLAVGLSELSTQKKQKKGAAPSGEGGLHPTTTFNASFVDATKRLEGTWRREEQLRPQPRQPILNINSGLQPTPAASARSETATKRLDETRLLPVQRRSQNSAGEVQSFCLPGQPILAISFIG